LRHGPHNNILRTYRQPSRSVCKVGQEGSDVIVLFQIPLSITYSSTNGLDLIAEPV